MANVTDGTGTGSTIPAANGGAPNVQPTIQPQVHDPDAGGPIPAYVGSAASSGGASSVGAAAPGGATVPGDLNDLLAKLLTSWNLREEREKEREEQADARRTPIEQGKYYINTSPSTSREVNALLLDQRKYLQGQQLFREFRGAE